MPSIGKENGLINWLNLYINITNKESRGESLVYYILKS